MNRFDFVRLNRRRLSATTLAALMFTAGQAGAMEATSTPLVPTDHKTIAGNACQLYGTMNSSIPLLKWFSYALNNNDTIPVTVVCPFVRDNALNTNGTANVLVNIYNPTAGTAFECALNSYGKFGDLIASDTASTTASGTATLTLDVNASAELGYYVLYCTMPPVGAYSSKIYSYTYREYRDTGAEGGVSVNPQLP